MLNTNIIYSKWGSFDKNTEVLDFLQQQLTVYINH